MIHYGVKNFAAATDTATPIIKTKILKDSFIFDAVAIQYVKKIIMKNKKQIICIAINNIISLIFNSMCARILYDQQTNSSSIYIL